MINECYGGFDLSLMALDRLADLKLGGYLNKYYYKIIIENNNYYALIKKVADDMDIFEEMVFDVGIILTNEIFNEEVTKLHVADFEKLDKLMVTNAEYSKEYRRADKDLIKVIEELGDKANTSFSYLKVVEIPDSSFWEIDNYDGWETLRYSETEIKTI